MKANKPKPESKQKEKESAAEKLAARMISRAKDKKLQETDPEAMMLNELVKKGNDFVPKGANPNVPLTPLQKIKEAIKNFDRYKEAWDNARMAVEAKIDEMNIADDAKADLKEKLNAFVEEELKYPFSKESLKQYVKSEDINNLIDSYIANNIDEQTTIKEILDYVSTELGVTDNETLSVIEDEVKGIYAKNLSQKYAAEVAKNNTISKLIDMYAEMGVDLSVAKDEVIDKIAFTLGITDEQGLDAFREIVKQRFEEVSAKKADAKAKRDLQKKAVQEAAKVAKEKREAEKKRTGGSNENVWKTRLESLAKGLTDRLAKWLLGSTPKQKTLVDEFADNLRKQIGKSIDPIIQSNAKEKTKKSALELLKDVIANKEAYKQVVEEARKALAEKYADNPAALLLLDDALVGLTTTSFTKNLTNEAINTFLKELGYSREISRNGKTVTVVNWKAIIEEAETIEEAKKAISDKLREELGDAATDAIIKQFEEQFDSVVAEKLAAQAEQIINKNLPKNNAKINTKRGKASAAFKIRQLLKGNNATAANVQAAIGNILGTNAMTPAQSATIQQLVEGVNNAAPGFIRAKKIEALQMYLNVLMGGNGVLALSYLRSAWVNNMLFTVAMVIKNITPVFDIPIYILGGVAQDTASGDFKLAPVINTLKGIPRAIAEALTVLTGELGLVTSTMDAETGGKEEINPRVLEYIAAYMPNLKGAEKLLGTVLGFSKWSGRLNESPDTYFASLHGSSYQTRAMFDYFHKTLGQDKKTAWTNARTATNWSLPEIQAAQQQAIDDLIKAGQSTSWSYVSRRMNEILDAKLPQAALHQKHSYQSQVTYKKSVNMGIADGLGQVFNGIFNAYKNNAKTRSGAVAKEAIGMVKAGTIPFVGMVSKFLESGLEMMSWGTILPVYGIAKRGKAQWLLSKALKQGDETKIADIRANIHAINSRILIATTLSLAYMLLSALSDDDDDETFEEWMVNGFEARGTENAYTKGKEYQQLIKKNRSAEVFCSRIGVEYMGQLGQALNVYADYVKKNKEKNAEYIKNGKDIPNDWEIRNFTASIFSAIIEYGYLSGIKPYAKIAAGGSDESFFKTLKRQSANATANMMPFGGGIGRMAADIYYDKAMEAMTWNQYFWKASGMVGINQIDLPKFDYRNRPFKNGDMYPNSIGGLMQSAGIDSPLFPNDQIDQWVFENDLSFSVPNKEDNETAERYSYSIYDKNGNFRFMEDEEYYDFKKTLAQKTDKFLYQFKKAMDDSGITDKEIVKKTFSKRYTELKDYVLYLETTKVQQDKYMTYNEYTLQRSLLKLEKEEEQDDLKGDPNQINEMNKALNDINLEDL